MIQKNIYIFKIYQLFIVYSILYFLLTWQINNRIFTNNYYYLAFGNQLSDERIEQIIDIRNKFQWIGYIIAPIIIFFKWAIISGIIYVLIIFSNKSISMRQCFRIVMVAELAMILATLAKLIFFLVHKPESIQDIQFFYPFSITQLFSPTQIPNYLVYPIQQLNLFEFAYWFLIASGIQTFIQKNFWQSLKITALSYGVAMFVWVLFVVFIQLQFS